MYSRRFWSPWGREGAVAWPVDRLATRTSGSTAGQVWRRRRTPRAHIRRLWRPWRKREVKYISLNILLSRSVVATMADHARPSMVGHSHQQSPNMPDHVTSWWPTSWPRGKCIVGVVAGWPRRSMLLPQVTGPAVRFFRYTPFGLTVGSCSRTSAARLELRKLAVLSALPLSSGFASLKRKSISGSWS